MRFGIDVILILALTGASAVSAEVIRGEVSLDRSGVGRVAECGTGRVIGLGTMASSPYFAFFRRYEALSSGGKMPVLIEVEGTVVRSSAAAVTLEHPRVLTLTQGRCDHRSP